MSAVPMLQALSWGGESPLLPCGEVDMEALAQGLARAEHHGGRRRKPYTRAQHAVVVSEAIDTLAGLSLPERRVLAMHAWLAEIRNSELRDKERAGDGKKRVALRTMDIEGLADVFARTSRWDAGPSHGGGMAPGVVAFDGSLKLLSDLNRRTTAGACRSTGCWPRPCSRGSGWPWPRRCSSPPDWRGKHRSRGSRPCGSCAGWPTRRCAGTWRARERRPFSWPSSNGSSRCARSRPRGAGLRATGC